MSVCSTLAKKEGALSGKAPVGKRILPIYSVTPFTMLDFPGKTACIVWFSGCNMRCGYCHNPQIVKSKGRGDIHQVLDFLEQRRGLLDGIVFSGGEASVYPELPHLIQRVKAMGFAVKLDTNGLRPDIIQDFLSKDFLDFIALDYKAPPCKFKKVTGTEKYDLFSNTLEILCQQNRVPFEVRTTVHTDLMNEADISFIIADLNQRGYRGLYAIQNFTHRDDRPTLGLMRAQTRILDRSALSRPHGFQIEYRNF